jgi:DNA-binding PadR family transcriptional regulator
MLTDIKLAKWGKTYEKRMAKEKFSLFLLWMISKKEQHGYEIIKTIREDPVMPNCAASKIYPILKELTKKGLISQKKAMQGKRVRKVYYITNEGKEMLKKAKEYIRKSRLMMAYVGDILK